MLHCTSSFTMQDLPFKKGDVLTVMNTSADPNWWVAKSKGGKEGMIPANYVELLPEGVGKLERSATLPRDASGKVGPMPWFHGKIARGTAEDLLKPYVDGTYLIRESTNYPGDYTLCVCFESTCPIRVGGFLLSKTGIFMFPLLSIFFFLKNGPFRPDERRTPDPRTLVLLLSPALFILRVVQSFCFVTCSRFLKISPKY